MSITRGDCDIKWVDLAAEQLKIIEENVYFDTEEIGKAASYLDKYLYLGGKKNKDVYDLLILMKKRKKDKNLPTY